MKVFITGSGGFIGGALAKHLERTGHAVLHHPGRAYGPLVVPEEADAVVNAAGRLGGKGTSRDELTEANALLPEALGSMCLEMGIPLVHLSTPGVCGLMAEGSEDLPFSPGGDYERTKAEGEQRLLALKLPPGALTILRPDFVFGAGDRHKLDFFRQAARGWFPVVGREGPRTRPTHSRDVCRAVLASLPGGRLSGGVYNVGGPQVFSMAALAREAGNALGKRVLVLPAPRWLLRVGLSMGPLRPGALTESRLRLFGTDRFVSIRKAATAGFTPRHTFAEACTEAVSWYREKGLL